MEVTRGHFLWRNANCCLFSVSYCCKYRWLWLMLGPVIAEGLSLVCRSSSCAILTRFGDQPRRFVLLEKVWHSYCLCSRPFPTRGCDLWGSSATPVHRLPVCIIVRVSIKKKWTPSKSNVKGYHVYKKWMNFYSGAGARLSARGR